MHTAGEAQSPEQQRARRIHQFRLARALLLGNGRLQLVEVRFLKEKVDAICMPLGGLPSASISRPTASAYATPPSVSLPGLLRRDHIHGELTIEPMRRSSYVVVLGRLAAPINLPG